MAGTPLRDRRPIPVQLGELIRRMIAEEGLRPGDQLPTESELAARFGLGRGSVREALKLLEQDGLITVRHGLGRFVSAIGGLEIDRPITHFESVTEMLGALRLQYTTEVLSVERAPADAEERKALELPKRAKVVRLRRIRRQRSRLLIYSRNSLPDSILGQEPLEAESFAGSLTEWLAARRAAPVSSVAQIRASSLPRDVPRVDPSDDETEWLLISERCVAENGRAVIYSHDYHRGDTFSFHVLRRRSG